MSPPMVKYTLDTLPPLTDKQKENLKRLASLPDSEIDLSDIPELTEEQIKKMKLKIPKRKRNA